MDFPRHNKQAGPGRGVDTTRDFWLGAGDEWVVSSCSIVLLFGSGSTCLGGRCTRSARGAHDVQERAALQAGRQAVGRPGLHGPGMEGAILHPPA
jgi:hypothetical protein